MVMKPVASAFTGFLVFYTVINRKVNKSCIHAAITKIIAVTNGACTLLMNTFVIVIKQNESEVGQIQL